MKKVAKRWRFSSAEPATKLKTTRLLAGEKLVLRKGIYFIMLLLVAVALLIGCDDDDDDVEVWEPEMEKLRAAITPYDFIEHAKHDGYDNEVTGYRPHMGFHYLNTSILDDKFEVEKPEVLLYAPDENNELKFVAVEYAVPIEDLDNPPPVPEGFKGNDDVWEINTEFKLWTLHVWVKLDNPNGIFASHNPSLH
jgi:hypothetical protein